MKKFIKPVLYSFSFFIIFIFILTILNFIGILPNNILNILKIVTIIISFLLNGYMIGKVSVNKGWLNGLESGAILLFLLLILSFILKIKFDIKIVLYYFSLLLVSIFGSMIGINRKRS